MVVPRSTRSAGAIRAQLCSAARGPARSPHWRCMGRRFYATGQHEGAKKASSDLPWLIGSVGLTVPAAAWLWSQNIRYQEKDHGHGDHDEHESDGEAAESESDETKTGESEGESPEEDKTLKTDADEGGAETEVKGDDKDTEQSGENEEEAAQGEKEGQKDDRPVGETVRNEPPNELGGSENKFSSGDKDLKQGPNEKLHKTSQQFKTTDPDADDGKKDGPSEDIDQGQEGEQKGTRVTEGDKTRKAEDPRTNSMHPYMADERKSKKGEGVVDTAKLTGTVDSGRKLR